MIDISEELKETLLMNAVRSDASQVLRKLQNYWSLPDNVVTEARKRRVTEVLACLE